MSLFTRIFGKPLPANAPNLEGDRDLEWGYVQEQLALLCKPGMQVLDYGCGRGNLSIFAAERGAKVVAVDLMPQAFKIEGRDIEFFQVDVGSLDESRYSFDIIINCSTVEHSGLPGRYNSVDKPNGDLEDMAKMLKLLKPGGKMIFTLPIGQDAVVMPLHRIYGAERFPKLINGFTIQSEAYWAKNSRNRWKSVSKEKAMMVQGNDHYYGLGCMILSKR